MYNLELKNKNICNSSKRWGPSCRSYSTVSRLSWIPYSFPKVVPEIGLTFSCNKMFCLSDMFALGVINPIFSCYFPLKSIQAQYPFLVFVLSCVQTVSDTSFTHLSVRYFYLVVFSDFVMVSFKVCRKLKRELFSVRS